MHHQALAGLTPDKILFLDTKSQQDEHESTEYFLNESTAYQSLHDGLEALKIEGCAAYQQEDPWARKQAQNRDAYFRQPQFEASARWLQLPKRCEALEPCAALLGEACERPAVGNILAEEPERKGELHDATNPSVERPTANPTVNMRMTSVVQPQKGEGNRFLIMPWRMSQRNLQVGVIGTEHPFQQVSRYSTSFVMEEHCIFQKPLLPIVKASAQTNRTFKLSLLQQRPAGWTADDVIDLQQCRADEQLNPVGAINSIPDANERHRSAPSEATRASGAKNDLLINALSEQIGRQERNLQAQETRLCLQERRLQHLEKMLGSSHAKQEQTRERAWQQQSQNAAHCTQTEPLGVSPSTLNPALISGSHEFADFVNPYFSPRSSYTDFGGNRHASEQKIATPRDTTVASRPHARVSVCLEDIGNEKVADRCLRETRKKPPFCCS